MPTGQKASPDKALSFKLNIRKSQSIFSAAEKNAFPSENTLATEAKAAQFRYRVLVVDDKPSICETASVILEREGYEVLTVAEGLDGLQALSKSLPDLIISDLNMPRMSGFEFLAIVRKRFPHIATIASPQCWTRAPIQFGQTHRQAAGMELSPDKIWLPSLGKKVGLRSTASIAGTKSRARSDLETKP